MDIDKIGNIDDEKIKELDKLIEKLEKTDKNLSKIKFRKSEIISNDIIDSLSIIINLFKKDKKTKFTTIRENIEYIIDYSNDYNNMEKLLNTLDIDFNEYNSIISENPDKELLEKVDKKLENILNQIDKNINYNDYQEHNFNILNNRTKYRNSQLDVEAENFSEKLYKKLYS